MLINHIEWIYETELGQLDLNEHLNIDAKIELYEFFQSNELNNYTNLEKNALHFIIEKIQIQNLQKLEIFFKKTEHL
jgi:hypothetical protein